MISLLITIAFVGLLVYLFTAVWPLPEPFRKIFIVVAVICTVLYVLSAFGLFGGSHDIAVPQLH